VLLGCRLAGHLFTVWKDEASIAVLGGAMSEMSARSGTGTCKLNIHPLPPSPRLFLHDAILHAIGCSTTTVFLFFTFGF